LGRRFAPADHRGAFVLPVAVALGYYAGYAVLPRSWAALLPQPNFSWQWLPYLGVFAAALAAISHALAKAGRTITWYLAIMSIAPVVGAALAPSWTVFGLTRKPMIYLIAAYLIVIGIPLQRLPVRLLNLSFLGAATTAATLLALVTGAMQSVTLSRLAAIAAGAIAGSTIACAIGPRPADSWIRGFVPVYVALVGGAAVVFAVEPDPPQPGLLAIGLLPLAMWLMVVIPIRKGQTTA
jgi:hypothetical protein